MATIYRFIVESKTSKKGSKRGAGGSGAGGGGGTAKKGKWVSYLDPERSGVEANRRMRAINPLLNKLTGGMWEKGTRLGRAGLGLVQKREVDGKTETRLSPTGVAIIIAFAINVALKHHQQIVVRNNEINQRNYKAIENGVTQVRSIQDITRNWYTGRITYNQNK